VKSRTKCPCLYHIEQEEQVPRRRNADDDSGKSGITSKIFDVVIGRRDNDEERQLGVNES